MKETVSARKLKPEVAIHVFSADERKKLVQELPWSLQAAIAEFNGLEEAAEKSAEATSFKRS